MRRQMRPVFLFGQNSRGQWVVQHRSGRSGGVFRDRAEALRFARTGAGETAEIMIVSGLIELDLGDVTHAASEALRGTKLT